MTSLGARVEHLLPFTAPLHAPQLFGHLAATAVAGVEEWADGAYRRSVRLAGGPAVVELHVPAGGAAGAEGAGGPAASAVRVVVAVSRPDDEPAALAVCRRLLDLDLDPAGPDDALAADRALAPLVGHVPGRRVPGLPDASEAAVRAVLGQQVSTAAARTHAARLVAALGAPVADGHDGDGGSSSGVTRLFPTAGSLARLDDDAATRLLALPVRRRAALLGLARALDGGRLDLRHVADGGDPVRAKAQLVALPGIGPWTAETVAMRALGDPDAFLASDLGVLVAARELGLPGAAAALGRHARAWSPWRSYAVQHLWGVLPHAINALPVVVPAVTPAVTPVVTPAVTRG